MEKLKKLLSLLLALAMVFSLAACGGEGNTSSGGSNSSAAGAEKTDSTYTYRVSYVGSPSTWSPTDWLDDLEAGIMSYTYTPLYAFVMNEAKDGYDIMPQAAAAQPEDVTAEYAGNETYGVPADATDGYAWKIALNPDLCWEDGTKITADDYIYSMQQFLNPQMKNYRASTYYSMFPLANAKAYYSNGGYLYSYASDTYDSGVTLDDIDGEVYINLSQPTYYWWDGYSFKEAYEDYDCASYFILEDGTDLYQKLLDEYGEDTDILVDEELYNNLRYLCGEGYEDDWIQWCLTREPAPETPWENVGLIKNDDYSITFVLTTPMTLFYVQYNLSSNFLVYEPLYEEYKKQTGDIVKSSYGTGVANYMSYGPYKLSSYQADKELTMTKNENWYGYSDPSFDGLYQTTGIEYTFVDEHTTAVSLFLQGKLDDLILATDDVATYGTSDYVYYIPQTFTYKFTFNSDYETLHNEDTDGINHSILSLDEFRHAISLSMDRVSFTAQTTAGAEAGYGLIDYVYVCDPDTGELYRDSEWAKQALCEFYGVEDESEITGYDKEAAAAMFQEAYDKAIEQGILKATDKIELDFHLFSDSTNNQNRVDFLQKSIDAATVGTDLEGKITINLVVDENYYDNCLNGSCDITYTAWGGSDMDPYNIIECYVSPSMTLEYGLAARCAATDLTINLNGEDVTHTITDWYDEMYTGTYATAESDIRNQILAALEKALLETYTMIPLDYDNSVCLTSQRIILGSDTYINSLVEYGGLEYMTYTMDDAEWEAYCAEKNNQLTY